MQSLQNQFVKAVAVQPRSTQPPVAPAASRLQYGRRRNANALPERGHIELIEPILAIISMKKLLIFQPKWVIYMSKNIFCLIKTCAQISNSLFYSVKLSTLYLALNRDGFNHTNIALISVEKL